VNKPLVDTEPHVVVHVAAVLAVNCRLAASVTTARVGEMLIGPLPVVVGAVMMS